MKSGQRTQSKYGGKCSGYAKQEIKMAVSLFKNVFFFFLILWYLTGFKNYLLQFFSF